MCDPTALIIAGSATQGVAGVANAYVEAESLEYNAKVAENSARLRKIQAIDVRRQGKIEEAQLIRDASKQLSEQATAIVGSGVALSGASAQEALFSTSRVGAADIQENQRNTARQVWGLETEGVNLEAKAKALRVGAKRTKRFAPLALVGPIVKGTGQAGVVESGRTR